MNQFTVDEMNLMRIYDTGTREGLIQELRTMRRYIESDQPELLAMTDSVLEKLSKISDTAYAALDLIPDFDEEE